MKGKYILGKCDYSGRGKKNNSVEVEWELADGNFSASGLIWNHIHSHAYSVGQNLDKILKLFPNDEKFKRIHKVWKRWHLNQSRTSCEHQRADGWGEEEIALTNYTLPPQVKNKLYSEARKAAIEQARLPLASVGLGNVSQYSSAALVLVALAEFGVNGILGANLTEEEASILKNRPGMRDIFPVLVKKAEIKNAGFVRPEEHPEGVLGKPCLKCGYRYGFSWLKEEIPQDIIDEIKSW